MHKIELYYKSRVYLRNYASKWDELTTRALIGYADAVAKGLQGTNLVLAVLYHWLHLPPKLFFQLNVSEMEDLTKTVEFLFEKDISCTRLIVKKLFHRGILFFGPGENWKNLTVAEYSSAEAYHDAFIESNDEQYKNNLIAALYRPTNPVRFIRWFFFRSDIRKKFNDRVAELRSKRIASMPEKYRNAVLYNFIAYKRSVMDDNKNLYRKKENAKFGESIKEDFGWAGVMHSMAGAELGPLEQVEEMNFQNALLILRKIDADVKEAKKKADQQRDQDKKGRR
ncbi:hypothetical protein BH11BAC1_BH11BAC1_30110 [soil metagenome]